MGKPTKDEESSFHKAELRLIVCDEYFKEKNGYKRRTEAIDNFLKEQLKNGKMTKAEAIKYSNDWFKAVSTWLKEYNAETSQSPIRSLSFRKMDIAVTVLQYG